MHVREVSIFEITHNSSTTNYEQLKLMLKYALSSREKHWGIVRISSIFLTFSLVIISSSVLGPDTEFSKKEKDGISIL